MEKSEGLPEGEGEDPCDDASHWLIPLSNKSKQKEQEKKDEETN